MHQILLAVVVAQNQVYHHQLRKCYQNSRRTTTSCGSAAETWRTASGWGAPNLSGGCCCPTSGIPPAAEVLMKLGVPAAAAEVLSKFGVSAAATEVPSKLGAPPAAAEPPLKLGVPPAAAELPLKLGVPAAAAELLPKLGDFYNSSGVLVWACQL